MEVGGHTQVLAYNVGLMAMLVGLGGEFPILVPGILVSWSAAC